MSWLSSYRFFFFDDAGEFAVPIFVTSAYLLVAAEIFLIGFLCGKCVSPSPENVHFLEDFKVNHKGFLFFQKFKKFYVLFGVFVGTVLVLTGYRIDFNALFGFVFSCLMTYQMLSQTTKGQDPGRIEAFQELLADNVKWSDTPTSVVYKMQAKAVRDLSSSARKDSLKKRTESGETANVLWVIGGRRALSWGLIVDVR